MTKLEKIEQDIRSLGAAELDAFRRWFAQFEADAWDSRFDDDVKAGRLDSLCDAAVAAHRRGRTRHL